MGSRTTDLVSVLAVLGLCTGTAIGNVLHVDDDAAPAGDGQSWETAYRFLQDALADAAASGGAVTEIRVAQGLYRPDRDEKNPDGTGDPLATFHLVDGALLAGGYAGLGAPNPDERDVSLHVTTLSGDLLGDDGPDFANNSDNSWHVVTSSGNDATAIIDGVTITAGNATGPNGQPAYHDSGGGLTCVGGSPTIVRCRIEHNAADRFGGGMHFTGDSAPTVSGSTFTGNVAQLAGGAIRSGPGSAAITNCSFVANRAESALRGGGAIAAFMSEMTVNGSVFVDNVTFGEGGAAAIAAGTATFMNSTVVGNEALWEEDGEGGGGGLCTTQAGTAHVVNCILFDNIAPINPQIFNQGKLSATYVSSSNTEGGLGGDGVIDDGGNIDAEPLFIDPGGADEDPANDFHLAAGSPSVGAGDLAAVPVGLLFDRDGNPRLIDCQVDMGAYEHQASLYAAGDTNCDGVVDVTDLVRLLTNWGLCSLCPADTDHDGDVDLSDLDTLLLNWD